MIMSTLSTGCASDTNDMMDGMSGQRPDRALGEPVDLGPVDVGPDALSAPPDAGPELDPRQRPPEPGPPLTLPDLALRGSFQSYHLVERAVAPIADFEHPEFPIQLGTQGVRALHFNLVFNTSKVFMVLHHGLADPGSRCLDSIRDCFRPIGEWSRANPGHAPIIVALDDPIDVPNGGFDGTLDFLQHVITGEHEGRFPVPGEFTREQVFTPDDLRALNPGLTLREIVTRGLWPPLDAMRGRFIFVILEPMARQSLRDLAWGLDEEPEVLFWPYVDGTDDAELAADDAAFAFFPPLEDEAAVARAEQVVDQGFITWTEAHDAETYARASAAGVHVIVSKFPDALFPAPGSDEWPVSCNPRTAPEGCRPRQIENRVP